VPRLPEFFNGAFRQTGTQEKGTTPFGVVPLRTTSNRD
jgi:hypothetical protein